MKEAETVRETLSNLTKTDFGVTDAPDDFQNRVVRPRWFVKCVDVRQARSIPHVNAAWKQQDGYIWLESLPLGDTIEWIEVAYGEEAAARSLDANYSDFGTKEFQAGFGRNYPLVFQRIQTYVEVADRVSKVRKVHLELRNNGSKGIVVFTLAARITADDAKTLEKKIGSAVDALAEAYAQAMQV